MPYAAPQALCASPEEDRRTVPTQARRSPAPVTRAEQWVVSATAALMVGIYGGSHPAFWAPVTAAFFLASAALALAGHNSLSRLNLRRAAALAAAVSLPVLHAVPMPSHVLEWLSPTRAFWVRQAVQTAGAGGAWSALSYHPTDTLFLSALWLGFGLSAFRVFDAARQSTENRDRFVRFLFALAVAEAAYGILQIFLPSLGVLWDRSTAYRGTARGTFINRNHYAAFLGMIWPVLLAYTLKAREKFRGSLKLSSKERRSEARHRGILFGFLTGLVLLALVFSMSRGGILCALIATSIFTALGATRRKELALAVAGCWLVLLAYGGVIGFHEILARFDRLENDAPGRFRLYRDTWRLIADHPWTGVGVGAFQSVFRIYQTHLPEFQFARHAHNDYFQWIAETGWPVGAATLAALWGFWIRNALRIFRWRRLPHPPDTTMAAGFLAGTAAVLFHSWVDFPLQMAGIALTFFCLNAMAAAEVKAVHRKVQAIHESRRKRGHDG